MLTKPAITETSLEQSAMQLWDEWLSSYFDGAAHTIGANAATAFPKAELAYQGKSLPLPLSSGGQACPLGISVVWVSPGPIKRRWDFSRFTPQQSAEPRAECRGMFQFLVRSDNTEDANGNGEYRCRRASDLLFALLNNPMATLPLAQKGIQKLAPSSPALLSRAVALDYHARQVTAVCRLRWSVLSV